MNRVVMVDRSTEPAVCMGADFAKPLRARRAELEHHCEAHGYTGPMAAVFLARGGHAPGAPCSLDPPPPEHEYWCPAYEGRDCCCGPALDAGGER